MAERDVQVRLSETGYEDLAEKLDQLDEKIDRLIEKFDQLDGKIAAPDVRLDGADEVSADLDGIAANLDEIGQKAATPEVQVEGIEDSNLQLDDFRKNLDEISPIADEADASLDGLAGAADNLTVSTEALDEAYSRFRDEVFEANPGIDDATASLLAQSAAAQAAGISMDEYAAETEAANHATGSFWDAINRLNTDLRYMGSGDILTVTRGMHGFDVQTGEAAEDLDQLFQNLDKVSRVTPVTEDSIQRLGLTADEAFMKGETALDKYRADLYSLSQVLRNVSTDAEEVGDSLEAAVNGRSGGNSGLQNLLEKLFSSGGGKLLTIGNGLSLSAGIGGSFVIAALMAEIGALVTGFSAAVMGIVPAVALAIPSIEKLDKAFHDSRAELAKLPAAERDTVEGIRRLKSEYDKLADSFAPDVFKILNDGVSVANSLLKQSGPLATDAAGGIESLLKQFDKFTQSNGFKAWVKQVSPDIKPAIEAIGTTIGTIVVDWGKFMTRFSPKDIQNAFHILDNLINWWGTFWGNMISHVMNMWDDLSAAFKNTKNWYNDVEQWTTQFSEWVGGKISNLVSTVRRNWDDANQATEHSWLSIGHTVEHATDSVRETVISAGHFVEAAWDSSVSRVVSYTDRLPSEVMHALASLPGDMLHMGEDAIDGLLHGLEGEAGGVLSWVEGFASKVGGIFADVLHIHSPSRVFVAYGVDIVNGLIVGVESKASSAYAAMQALGKKMASEYKAALSLANSTTSSILSNATLGNAISNISGPVTGSGIEAQMQKFLSQIRQFGTAIKRLAHDGLNKNLLMQLINLGPFQGLAAARALADGPLSVIRQLNATERQIENAAGYAGRQSANAIYGGVGGVNLGGTGVQKLEVEWVGSNGADAQFISWLKKQIRIHGGNPTVLGAR